jgi:MoaA/NifB/PqqE/SkfB family radical SAM enzyme
MMITNATLLRESAGQAILDTGLDSLVVSIDGATRSTYERIRRGASFDAVLRNIERFNALRAQRGMKTPLIYQSFEDIWNGEDYAGLRRELTEGNFRECCRNCCYLL